ncbi:MAG: fumarate hydratase [Thermoplasmata archaeon]|nr:MAG: fumarate hydratase [Thermoplasmata archaeon]
MEYYLNTPFREDIRKLKTGDIVYLSGTVITARDKAHMKAINSAEKLDFLSNSAIYHCGPIMRKNGEWEVVVAGPTTSSRMEAFEHEFIKKFGVRMVIGKGGMGSKTAEACREHGAVYCTFTGGAAVLAARAIKSVRDVIWLDELGTTEAMWVFEVEKFGPLVVAIDSHGNNLTEEIKMKAEENLKEILRFV